MAIQTHFENNTLTITLGAQFDAANFHEFEQAIEAVLNDQVNFIINMHGLKSIDSSGLGMLALLWKYIHEDSSRIQLTQCSPYVLSMLEQVFFAHIMNAQAATA